MIEEKFVDDAASAARSLANAMIEALDAGIRERGRAGIAVSGGRTPEAVLPLLAASGLPWDKIAVTLTDERWLPSGHPDSNQGLAMRLLPEAKVTGLYTGHATPEEGLEACEKRLACFPFPLDAVFLGMGADGHVASLFPGQWADVPGRCLAAAGPPGSHPRISLSPRALLDARQIFLLVAGKEKLATYARARRPGPATELPLRLVLSQKNTPVGVFIVRSG